MKIAVNVQGRKVFLVKKQIAQKAIDLFEANRLKKLSQTNVEGHWI